MQSYSLQNCICLEFYANTVALIDELDTLYTPRRVQME